MLKNSKSLSFCACVASFCLVQSGYAVAADREYQFENAIGEPFSRDLVFVALRDGDIEIFVRDENGDRRITNNPGNDMHPSWSADGRYFVYSSTRDGNADIYRADIKSGKIKRLTEAVGFDGYASYSPDGSTIAFISENAEAGEMELRLMNAKKRKPSVLYSLKGEMSAPEWSPDSKKIAVAATHPENMRKTQILSIDVASGEATPLTVGEGVDFGPAWSADASTIAYSSYRGRRTQLFVVDVEGDKEERQLTETFLQDIMPVFSPSGDEIYFSGTNDQTRHKSLYAVKLDGTGRRIVADSQGEITELSVDPDGGLIWLVAQARGYTGMRTDPETEQTSVFLTQEKVLLHPAFAPVERK